MCKTDKDCNGNGYCQARECKCSANYEYAQDCSIHGCKYIRHTANLHVSFYFYLNWKGPIEFEKKSMVLTVTFMSKRMIKICTYIRK